MVNFSSLVAVSFSVVTMASPFGKRTVGTVEADIAAISTSLTGLDNAINSFPSSGGSLLQALGIHTAATPLETAVEKATTDVRATCSIDESDATTILNSVEAFEALLVDALSGLITKLPAFQSLPLGGVPALVKQDITILCLDFRAFEAALHNCVPADLEPLVEDIEEAIDAACSRAMIAYSSA